MGSDLLIIVPSRGRPSSIARLLEAVHRLRQLDTHVVVGTDADDETLPQYEKVFEKAAGDGDWLVTQERLGLAEYTNYLAMMYAERYPYLASFGDDHLPVTLGFDRLLCRGIEDMGGTGFTYPWDGQREDIPQAVVMSSNIVRGLNWMCLPGLQHYYVDNVWADLGRQSGCIRHLRTVLVEHVHPGTGKAKIDDTYSAAAEKLDSDRDAYETWRREELKPACNIIQALRETPAVVGLNSNR
jgi:hypothetical protein